MPNPHQHSALEVALKFSPFKQVLLNAEDLATILLPAILLRWLEREFINIAKKKNAIVAPVDVADYPAYLAEVASLTGASELIMQMIEFHNQNTATLGVSAKKEQDTEQTAAYDRGAAILRKDF